MKSLFALILSVTILAGCDSLKNLPTNTSGNLFSLNGTWRLEKSNDANAMAGTTITVLPVTGQGTIASVANNTYCLREKDIIWNEIKNTGAGGFTLNNLVNSCGGAPVYKPATILVLTNDTIRLSGENAAGYELTQDWVRVRNQ